MDVSDQAVRALGPVIALLGPTNTGKTHDALQRMMTFKTGVIGFPLRLLARENYDKVVQAKGAHAVALVTGEEKIIPPRAKYYMCTVESMPVDQDFEFFAVDEIQLAADPDRGHIFTDRLLRGRGTQETMFMGSDIIRPVLSGLVPGIRFESKSRFSQLTYAGFKKLTRLPKRSAVVAFSMDDVYAMAELIRRQRGGTAVVLGALSPRTRNAQVDMYQSGEVDFMVATDAIGMGLNMDIRHVALASTQKFDGHKLRSLTNAEMGQIAGRAGRYMKDGTFGVTGRVHSLPQETIDAVENHQFKSLEAVCWRNSALEFDTPRALLKSLEAPTGNPLLMRGRAAEDMDTLKALLKHEDILARANNPEMVRLLWEVCQVPDFRKTMSDSHHDFMAQIYSRLSYGPLAEDWVVSHVQRLDDYQGDVDTLMNRIAHVRSWTYMAYKPNWLAREDYWREYTRMIEDKLSDALHEALIRRFVDRRTALLMQAEEEGRALLAGIRKSGEVLVEGHLIGHLKGFRFIPDESAKGPQFKAVMNAARKVLKDEIKDRLNTMLNAQAKQFRLMDDGQIFYQDNPTNPLPGAPLARVRKGQGALRPAVDLIETDLLAGHDAKAVKDHLETWLMAYITETLETLAGLDQTEGLAGPVRGICFQLHESMGIVPREQLEDLIKDLDQEMRQTLRNKKIRLGPILVFMPALNKPASVRLRGLLWALWNEKSLPMQMPKDGIVSYGVEPKHTDHKFQQAIGYPVFGPRAIRIDMLDRVISAVYDGAKEGKFRAEHKMAEWLGCSIDDLYAVLEAMGHRRIHEQAPAPEKPAAEGAVAEAPAEQAKTEEAPTLDSSKPDAQVKPELALFRLKKGKAFEKPAFKPRTDKKEGGEKFDKKHGKKFDKKRGGKEDRPMKIMQSGPKPKLEDSPFAVLQQLKQQKDS